MGKVSVWDLPINAVLSELQSQKEGLSEREAQERAKTYGANTLKPPTSGKGFYLFFAQFKSPLILLLSSAAILSFALGGAVDALIILSIVMLSGLLGYFQEYGALNSLETLLQQIETKTSVLREGKEIEISSKNLVPGDVILLRAGDLIPADCMLIDTKHFFVDEASMTGESLPIEKMADACSPTIPLLQRPNNIFLGTLVMSGFASALVICTGIKTEYAKIAEHIRFRPPETSFEMGVRKLSQFLLQVTLILVIVIFAINSYFHKDIIESLLFSLALAVGLTPQLLPAIISVNLSHGARQMAQKKVIIKRLPSIENFGQMDILCSDKTGTLTLNKMTVKDVFGITGQKSNKAKLYAFLNAHFQEGYTNPLDQAILADIPQREDFPLSTWKKIDEIPYDFHRKKLSVTFLHNEKKILITKGTLDQVLAVCTQVELPDESTAPLDTYKKEILQHFEKYSKQGFRILGIAYGEGEAEENLRFLGFIHFFDPIKPNIEQAVAELKKKRSHFKNHYRR